MSLKLESFSITFRNSPALITIPIIQNKTHSRIIYNTVGLLLQFKKTQFKISVKRMWKNHFSETRKFSEKGPKN